jgi:hypothetical protein
VVCFDHIRFRFPLEKFQSAARWPDSTIDFAAQPFRRVATSRRLFDRSDVTYPLLAITLAARRDNLRDTLAVFEQRLATIKAPPVEPVAA